ncbi:efflux RND transporter periplasmic adaptor subunit [Geobacter sp. SVR]|uniref:efflux RND transporter periplasmic adaptor subunit n=1 Tax=Geobacter sp. SVR TaxID=2495594 RepID=UPI001562F0CB|nr:efflux RND transporter periplasmic adaptor subunit [Geobacter sp. SVR]
MAEDLSGLRIDKTGGDYRPRRRWKRLAWWLGGACVALTAVLAFKGLFSPRVEVETAVVSQVYPSQSFSLLNASGYVVAQRKSAVAAKTTGRLVWLGVEEGSRVRGGQVIARLENEDVTANRRQAAANLVNSRAVLAQAEAELKDATLTFNRNKELLSQGVVAQADLDASEARYKRAVAGVAAGRAAIDAARAALRGADVAVDYTLIRAPFDGVVLTKDADVGDIVTPIGAAVNAKAAVVTMADMGSLQVEADVSESSLQKVRQGQPCEIQLDALPETRFSGTVHMIVPTADRSKATVLAKVRFDRLDSRILPEMSARVAFLQRQVTADEKRPRTAVNPAAVVKRDNRDCIYLIAGDRVKEVPVTVGRRIGDQVEILAGAKAGDKVALKPLERLKDGSRIKTAEK